MDLLINDKEAHLQDRQLTVIVMAIAEPQSIKIILNKLLVPNESFEIQKTAIETIHPKDSRKVVQLLIEQWPSLTPNISDKIIGIFTYSVPHIKLLLDALEKRIIDPWAINWHRQMKL